MAVPALIGAGVGAATSLATGRDPMRGALMGGFTGGLFGGPDSLFYNDISGLFGSMSDQFTSKALESGVSSGITDLATRDAVGDLALGLQLQDTAPGIGVDFNQMAVNDIFTPGVNDVFKEIPYESIRGVAPNMSYIPGQIGNVPQGVQLDNAILNQTPDPNQIDNILFPKPADQVQKTGMEKLYDIGRSAVDYAKDNPFKTGIGAVGLLSVLDPSQTTIPSQGGGGSIKAGQPDAVRYNQMLSTYVPQRNKQQFKLG